LVGHAIGSAFVGRSYSFQFPVSSFQFVVIGTDNWKLETGNWKLETISEEVVMKISDEGQLLRVFVGESDKWEGRPLYEALVLKAREMGLAGATMLRGLMGYGAASRIHTAKILRLSEDLPVLVEIVDSPEKIASFLPVIDEMVKEGLVTLERVQVIIYRHDAQRMGY
jgi:uncharacterized protein